LDHNKQTTVLCNWITTKNQYHVIGSQQTPTLCNWITSNTITM